MERSSAANAPSEELPTEESGPTALVAPDREETWVRRLFEKAVLGFAQVELEPAKLEGELGERDHEAVCRLIPTDLIKW
jgi:hypothetical protein